MEKEKILVAILKNEFGLSFISTQINITSEKINKTQLLGIEYKHIIGKILTVNETIDFMVSVFPYKKIGNITVQHSLPDKPKFVEFNLNEYSLNTLMKQEV